MQKVAPAAAVNLPEGHFVHVLVVGLYHPAGHVVHVVAPGVDEYVPVVQKRTCYSSNYQTIFKTAKHF